MGSECCRVGGPDVGDSSGLLMKDGSFSFPGSR